MLPLSLLKTAQNHPLLVELKSGETYNGHLVLCDTWMNLHLKEVICTSKDGDRFWRMAEAYIRGNTIKYIRVPDEVINEVQEERFSREDKRPQRGGRGGGRSWDGGRGGRGGRGGEQGHGEEHGGGGRGGLGGGRGGRGGRGGPGRGSALDRLHRVVHLLSCGGQGDALRDCLARAKGSAVDKAAGCKQYVHALQLCQRYSSHGGGGMGGGSAGSSRPSLTYF